MPKYNNHLPTIPVISERDKRGEKRELAADKADLAAAIKLMKITHQLEAEEEKAFIERQYTAALHHLNRLSTGNAHVYFHGISDTAKLYQMAENSL